MRTSSAVLLTTLLISAAGIGRAEDPKTDPVAIELAAQKVEVAADGNETLAEAKAVRPGDVIQYSATYSNGGKAEVKGLQGTLPIPAGMAFLPGTESPRQVLASTDGVVFDTPPLRREVELPDGTKKFEAVPLGEYRYLRWSLDALEPGGKRVVSARMRIDR